MMKNRSYDTTIVSFHLDKNQNKKELDDILSLTKKIYNSTCVIIFSYPQSIPTKYPQLIHTIQTLVWFVVVK